MAKKFEISYPVKPYSVNQGFGIENTAPSALPTYIKLGLKGHNGLDLHAIHGEPVYATHDGIAYYEVDDNQGDGFVIRTTEQFDYKDGQAYFKSIYWHLCAANDPHYKPLIPTDGRGYPVKKGDLIGYADNTGLSTGDHLHFSIKPIALGGLSPQDATDTGIGNFTNIEALNGYFGAIDPTPYFDGFYAVDTQKVAEIETEIPIVQSRLAILIQAIKRYFNLY